MHLRVFGVSVGYDEQMGEKGSPVYYRKVAMGTVR